MDDDVETMVADVESLDTEPVLCTLSNCDEGRLSDFLLGDDSERADDVNLLLLPPLLLAPLLMLPFSDNGGVGLWPICETVLHKLPNGGYLARTLSVNSLV